MGCFGSQNPQIQIRRDAQRMFNTIDYKHEGKIDTDVIKEYFNDYGDGSAKILLNEMDLNNDGVITKEEWLAYWQYIRLSGYDYPAIKKSLDKMRNGDVFLNFPLATRYESVKPRETVINGIIQQMRTSQSVNQNP